MMMSNLKEKLANGGVVVGPFYKLNCPGLVEMFGYAGLDFIIVDNEHSNFSYSEMESLIRAADGLDLNTIIRVPSAAEEHLLHALDSGASGVQIPGLTTVDQVRAALPHTRYFPDGNRGLNMTQRAANYGFMGKAEYFSGSNKNTLTVVHVENKEMADQIEDLCQVPNLDVIFVGPGDLSQSLGKPGQVNDPEVVSIAEKVIRTAVKHKKYAGMAVGNPADAEKYIKMGAQYIGFGNDIGVIGGALRDYGKAVGQIRAMRA